MFKKLFVVAAAAAVVSVPFAGASWAEPSDQGNEGGIGAGGMPKRINDIAQHNGLPDPNGKDEPNNPGSVIHQFQSPGELSTPEAYKAYLDLVLGNNPYPAKTPVGMGVKAAGPGCNRGHTAADLGEKGNCPR